MNTGQGDPGALGQAAYGDVKRLEKRVEALERRETRAARHAKYLLWLDTYNAALTGLIAGRIETVTGDDGEVISGMAPMAEYLANRLHGEQS